MVGETHALGLAELAQVCVDDLAQELVVIAEAIGASVVAHLEHEVKVEDGRIAASA